MLYKTLQFNLPKEIANVYTNCVYSIGEFPESVNGQKYWTSTDEKYALWYFKDKKTWIFGSRRYLGNDSGFIFSVPGEVIEDANIARWPHYKVMLPYEKKTQFTIFASKEWKLISDFNFVLSERKCCRI